jgi:hypothetical protein
MFRRAALSLILAFVFAGCEQSISPLNVTAQSHPENPVLQSPCAAVNLLEDFEAGLGGYWYFTWCGLATSWSTAQAHCGTHSAKFVGPNSASQGCGGGTGFSYSASFPSATKLEFWAWVSSVGSAPVQYQFYWTEGGTNIDWKSPQSLAGNSSWTKVSIPLSSMTPSAAASGPNPGNITAFWFDDNGPYNPNPAHTMYIDDISFPN